jgi:hypothetical protein
MCSLNHNPINKVYKKISASQKQLIISEFGNLRPLSLVRSLYGEWRTSLTDLPNKTGKEGWWITSPGPNPSSWRDTLKFPSHDSKWIPSHHWKHMHISNPLSFVLLLQNHIFVPEPIVFVNKSWRNMIV